MPNRYSHEQDRPRDDYGRFESESGHERRGSSQDRPRDEYGRFESEFGHERRGSSQDRPRDEYGRFESESGYERRSSSQDRARDEYGRFESSQDPRRRQERPRYEYGRFESGRGWGGTRQSYYGGGESYGSQEYRGYDDRGDEQSRYGSQWEGRGRSSAGMGNDYNDRPYERGGSQAPHMSWGRSEMGATGRWSQSNRGGERPESSGRYSENVGRGPKGYRRADERIEEDVNEALTESPELDASEIEVKVSNGEVTLSRHSNGSIRETDGRRHRRDLFRREGCSQ